MSIASFSTKKFIVSSDKVRTFDSLERSSSIETEETENGSKKQKIKMKAVSNDDLSFNVKLDYSFNIVPQEEFDKWVKQKDKGKAYFLIIGGKSISSNKWLLTDVSLSETKYSADGILMKANLKLTFKETYYKKKKKTAKSTRKK